MINDDQKCFKNNILLNIKQCLSQIQPVIKNYLKIDFVEILICFLKIKRNIGFEAIFNQILFFILIFKKVCFILFFFSFCFRFSVFRKLMTNYTFLKFHLKLEFK